ncbi:membrane protein insertion efficiency factor YidD [Edwardsiella tarda]|uniref:membrane protein insertion efficiency factor YidD n=1 Tax=Edwardsiella tarda TaxID=636 RepID=UPI003C6EC258
MIAQFISLRLIYLYRKLAPDRIRKRCRYEPTCSAYAISCIKRFGAVHGWRLAIRRIRSCHPPNGGRDLPPTARK